MQLRPIKENKLASISMIGTVVALLVAIIVSVLVVYNMGAAIDTGEVDEDLQDNFGTTMFDENTTYAGNATVSILDQTATFYTIAPIIAVVIVAVVILGYVGRIGRG